MYINALTGDHWTSVSKITNRTVLYLDTCLYYVWISLFIWMFWEMSTLHKTLVMT